MSDLLRHCRRWLGGLWALGLALGIGTAGARVPDADDFARPPRMSGFTVSPGNEHAALLLRTDKGRLALAVVDLAQPAEVKVVVAYADANVTQVMWVNDRRLVYHASRPGVYAEQGGGGTFAVDLDGGRPRQLTAYENNTSSTGTLIRSRVLPFGWLPWRATNGRSDEVLIYRFASERHGEAWTAREIARLDTVTGAMTPLSHGQPPFAENWVFDAEGELRVVTSNHQGVERLHLRSLGQDGWTVLEEHPAHSDHVLTPLYIEGDGQLVVSTRRGRDTQALYTYDTRNRRLGAEPLLAVNGFDIEGWVVRDERLRQIVGARLQASSHVTVWFEEGLAGAQTAVDRALPQGRTNVLHCGNCAGAQRFVVRSSGPRLSAEYLVYDKAQGRITSLGKARPWLDEASQGDRSFHRVAARDGLMLPVVMTHPPGSRKDEPLPAVVLVHGGPWVRGTDVDWSVEAQFLATRGYRVIEVDFRGSTGLGWKHYRAGWKQYGLAMQDDLADALAWAVKSRSVDPQRVCIAGSSYGGYAALMGPVMHPGLYRCAASHAGVTDLNLLFSGTHTDIPERLRRHSLRQKVGDPEADAEMLRRQSPVNRAAEIRVPVLLAQGALDVRVTPAHANRFASAARAAGASIEEVNYPQEAHGWTSPANHADYLNRLQGFLSRVLRARADNQAPGAEAASR